MGRPVDRAPPRRGGSDRARDPGRVRAAAARDRRDRGARRGGADCAPARGRLLALLLPRVVLSAGGGGAVRSISEQPRGAAHGAGSSTCSIALARIGSVALITTAFSHGSSEEVSNLVGIWVTIASTACSRLTPITPPRGPVMPTSVMYAVPPGSTLASA